MDRPKAFPTSKPIQSLPPVLPGLTRLKADDPVTAHLRAVAAQGHWDEWHWCWDHLPYLPSWQLIEIWDVPKGWTSPHEFICWLAWHCSAAYHWLWRLKRQQSRGHSLESLLSDARPMEPSWLSINKSQVEQAQKRVYRAMRWMHVQSGLYLPTRELVEYPAWGLLHMLTIVDNYYMPSRGRHDWYGNNRRATRRADRLRTELVPTIRFAALITNNHLNSEDETWSES